MISGRRTVLVLLALAVLAAPAAAWDLDTHEDVTEHATDIVEEEDRRGYEDLVVHDRRMRVGSRQEDLDKRYVNHFRPGWDGYTGQKRSLALSVFGLPLKNNVTSEGQSYKTGPDWIYDDGWGRNWVNAVRIYGYTEASRDRAYLRLGHVLHIVEDLGNLDHVEQTAHPGSTKDGRWFNGVFRGSIPSYPIGTVPEEAHPEAEGFERFVDERPRLRTRGPTWVDLGNQPADLPKYFDRATSTTRTKADAAGVESPLGLTEATVEVAGVTDGPVSFNARPAITEPDAGDDPPSEDNVGFDWQYDEHEEVVRPSPFERYARTTIHDLTGITAGVQKMFHDIVNQPPYVQRFQVHGKYDGEWENQVAERSTDAFDESDRDHRGAYLSNGDLAGTVPTVESRELRVRSDPLECGETYDVTITFGPNQAEVVEKIRNRSVMLTVGNTPLSGELTDDNVWEGEIPVPPTMPQIRRQYEDGQVKISARDIHEHALLEGPDSGELDAEPGSPARLVATDVPDTQPPSFTWRNYPSAAGSEQPDLHHVLDFTCDTPPRDPPVDPPDNDSGDTVTIEPVDPAIPGPSTKAGPPDNGTGTQQNETPQEPSEPGIETGVSERGEIGEIANHTEGIDCTQYLPGLVDFGVEDLRANVEIGSTTIGVVTNGSGVVTRAERGAIEDPDYSVETDLATVRRIRDAEDPRAALEQAIADGDVTWQGQGLGQSVASGVAKAGVAIRNGINAVAGLIGGLSPFGGGGGAGNATPGGNGSAGGGGAGAGGAGAGGAGAGAGGGGAGAGGAGAGGAGAGAGAGGGGAGSGTGGGSGAVAGGDAPPAIDCVRLGAWNAATGTYVGVTHDVTDPDGDLENVSIEYSVTDSDGTYGSPSTYSDSYEAGDPVEDRPAVLVEADGARSTGRVPFVKLTVGANAVLSGSVTVMATDAAGNERSRTEQVSASYGVTSTDYGCSPEPGT